jgi:hypothetical protein
MGGVAWWFERRRRRTRTRRGSGGGSLGVYVHDSTVTLTDGTRITGGDGGAGGVGGPGARAEAAAWAG